jgi:hypothetical protein
MPSPNSNIDFIVYDKEGQIILLAEAKSRRGTSEHWAARLRKNMLSHGTLPWAQYFLIATPERMYLWRQEPKQEHADPAEIPPEFTIDAAKEFRPYFQKLHLEPSDMGPEAFELLVLTWLTDIAWSGENGHKQESSSPLPSEFTGSLQRARIETNPVQ